jgi:glycine/D-amino acid oxidase-like deaminating enzyme
VRPARLALGLRQRLLDRRVRIFECTRATALEDGDAGVRIRTAGGEVGAGRAVLAINHAIAGVAPLRGAVSVASSHVVATEPVLDVLDALGWTGGEGIADCRTMLHCADEAEATGRRTDPLTRAVAAMPRLLGLHLPR